MIAGIDSEIDLKSGVYFTLQTIAKSGHVFVCLGKLLFICVQSQSAQGYIPQS